MKFSIKFFGPFLIGGVAPGDGFDMRIDRDAPIPASSLKGRLRAEAKHMLRINNNVLEEIFGTTKRCGQWWFSDVDVKHPTFELANRVAMDSENPDSGRPDEHQLVFFEQCWAKSATFTIEPFGLLDQEKEKQHQAVLQAAALSVTNIGGMRRRGHGWVAISPEENLDKQELLRIVRSLQK